MRSLEALKKDATLAMKFRGHLNLTPWSDRRYFYYGNETGLMECKDCGMYVQVQTKPPPNDIRIGGSGVAKNCNRKAVSA